MVRNLFWWWPFGKVAEIEPRQLHEQASRSNSRKKQLQLIDVRSVMEYEQGHIKGARSVPIHRLRGELASLNLDPARPVIAICKTAHRSVPAVRLLRQQGYDAQQLAGGMNAWRAAGLPETKG